MSAYRHYPSRHSYRRLTTNVVSFARTSPRSENPVHWEPLDSPYTDMKKAVFKVLVKVRAAFILLFSSWFMKPSHFRPEADSIYKNLGWVYLLYREVPMQVAVKHFLDLALRTTSLIFSPPLSTPFLIFRCYFLK